jgi:hypothetical protein
MSFMSFQDEVNQWEDEARDFRRMQEAVLMHKAQRNGLHPLNLLMVMLYDDECERFSGMTQQGWWLSQQVKHFSKWVNDPRVKKHDNRAKLTVKQWVYLLELNRVGCAFKAIEDAMDKGMKPKSAICAVLRSVGNEEGIHYGQRKR